MVENPKEKTIKTLRIDCDVSIYLRILIIYTMKRESKTINNFKDLQNKMM